MPAFVKIMNLIKILKILKENYFIFIFSLILFFVISVISKRIFFTKTTFIYTKIKVGQGFWWAGGQKPGYWLAKSINKGDKLTNLGGQSEGEILSVKIYPWVVFDQYDTYLDVKLKVTSNKKNGKYIFNRNSIGIGSPIELEFPNIHLNGTIINISKTPLNEKFIEKEIILTKQLGYSWEFDAIKIGDNFNNGEEVVFEIIEKSTGQIENILLPQKAGRSYYFKQNNAESRLPIFVKARIKVKESDKELIFAEEQSLIIGKVLNIVTSTFAFNDFVITSIK